MVGNDCEVVFKVEQGNRINIGADVINNGLIFDRIFKGFIKDCIGVVCFVNDHLDWRYF